MPGSEATMVAGDRMSASVERSGDTLLFRGALRRATIAGLWKPALAALPGVRCIDLHAVSQVDSAGLALLAELAARAPDATIDGVPTGQSGLRSAYRLDPGLRYAA